MSLCLSVEVKNVSVEYLNRKVWCNFRLWETASLKMLYCSLFLFYINTFAFKTTCHVLYVTLKELWKISKICQFKKKKNQRKCCKHVILGLSYFHQDLCVLSIALMHVSVSLQSWTIWNCKRLIVPTPTLSLFFFFFFYSTADEPSCYCFPTQFKPQVSTEHTCVDKCILTTGALCFSWSKQSCTVHGQSALCFVGFKAEPKINSWSETTLRQLFQDWLSVNFNFSCFVHNHRLCCLKSCVLLFLHDQDTMPC